MENTREDDVIDLMELFLALKKRLLLLVTVGLLFGCIACAYTRFFINPVYTSSSTMLVLTKETTLASVADLQLGAQLTSDYSVLINSRPVMQEVVDNLGLEMDYKQLRSSVTITNPEDTRILQLTVQNGNPEAAKAIVDELAKVSSAYIGDKMEVTPPKIIEDGEVPTTQTSPSMKKNAIMGILAGLVFSGGIIVVMTLMNDTIKSEEDITKYLGLSTLSSVPDRKDYIGKKKNRKRKNGKKNRKNAGKGRK